MRSFTVYAVAVLLFAPALAMAQNDSPRTSLIDGKSALLFEVVGDFDLTAFEGANLSYKHHYTDNRAYRIGVGVSLSHESRDEDGSVHHRTEYEVSRSSVSLTALKLYYRGVQNRGSVYWGVGPRIGYARDKNTYETPDWYDDATTEYTHDRANAGVACVLGVEWFLAREFSLLAQYGTVLEYSWSKDEETRKDQVERPDYSFNQERSTVELRADVVRFGLSLYW
jgi:hypothetical protein